MWIAQVNLTGSETVNAEGRLCCFAVIGVQAASVFLHRCSAPYGGHSLVLSETGVYGVLIEHSLSVVVSVSHTCNGSR